MRALITFSLVLFFLFNLLGFNSSAACGEKCYLCAWHKVKYIHKSHNVTVLLHHIVLLAKYRRVVFIDTVDITLKDTWDCVKT